jgi:hypothetical protein
MRTVVLSGSSGRRPVDEGDQKVRDTVGARREENRAGINNRPRRKMNVYRLTSRSKLSPAHKAPREAKPPHQKKKKKKRGMLPCTIIDNPSSPKKRGMGRKKEKRKAPT